MGDMRDFILCLLLLSGSKFLLQLAFYSVYADGSICLDILQNQWSPIYDVAAILTSIQVMNYYIS